MDSPPQPPKEAVGITVKKSDDFSEWYTQVVMKAGLADYAPVKGFIVLRPYGYAIWESIRDLLDRRFKETGHQNGFLPVVIPEGLLSKEEDHFAGFTPEVFWVTKAGNNELGERLALRPTSETLAYSIFAKWISSYRDLPLKINFWNTALRAEIKATKPFIRTSEFLWQEGHTVHETEEDAEKEVMSILGIYRELIEEYLAVPAVRGFKSDKEKFVGAKYTTTLEGMMADGKALQMGTSHHLAQNFSKPFEIKYLGRDTKEHLAWQTSWGVSWRLIGAIIMVHGDDKGLVLPPRIAPIQVVVVPIHKDKDAQAVKEKAYEIAQDLKGAGIRTHVDDRDEYTSGWKFNEWELKGVPLRVNIGARDIEKGQVEFARRDGGRDKTQWPRAGLVEKAKELLDAVQKNLFAKARALLDGYISSPAIYPEFRSIIEGRGGFARAGWCGEPKCEMAIKEETGADIRVIPFDQDSMPEKCIYCGQPAKKVAMFGRAY
ncbi:MAG TPA: proline--tRNA ligase [Nitrososphaera sp.]|nr:proline--tRNA ligase [Nitrososphaera sp.]